MDTEVNIKTAAKRMILSYIGVGIVTFLAIFFFYENPNYGTYFWIMLFFAFFMAIVGSLGYVFRSGIKKNMKTLDWIMLVIGSLLLIIGAVQIFIGELDLGVYSSLGVGAVLVVTYLVRLLKK